MNAARLAAFLKSLDMALAAMPPQAKEGWIRMQIEHWQDRRHSDEIVSSLRERLAAVGVAAMREPFAVQEQQDEPSPAPAQNLRLDARLDC